MEAEDINIRTNQWCPEEHHGVWWADGCPQLISMQDNNYIVISLKLSEKNLRTSGCYIKDIVIPSETFQSFSIWI